MFAEVDNFFFDMDVLSSPIAERDDSFSELNNEDFFNPQIGIQSYPDMMKPTGFEQKQQLPFDYGSFDLKPSFEPVKPVQNTLKPKAKKEVLVFQPFASFEATELTVKALMGKCFDGAVIRL